MSKPEVGCHALTNIAPWERARGAPFTSPQGPQAHGPAARSQRDGQHIARSRPRVGWGLLFRCALGPGREQPGPDGNAVASRIDLPVGVHPRWADAPPCLKVARQGALWHDLLGDPGGSSAASVTRKQLMEARTLSACADRAFARPESPCEAAVFCWLTPSSCWTARAICAAPVDSSREATERPVTRLDVRSMSGTRCCSFSPAAVGVRSVSADRPKISRRRSGCVRPDDEPRRRPRRSRGHARPRARPRPRH